MPSFNCPEHPGQWRPWETRIFCAHGVMILVVGTIHCSEVHSICCLEPSALVTRAFATENEIT